MPYFYYENWDELENFAREFAAIPNISTRSSNRHGNRAPSSVANRHRVQTTEIPPPDARYDTDRYDRRRRQRESTHESEPTHTDRSAAWERPNPVASSVSTASFIREHVMGHPRPIVKREALDRLEIEPNDVIQVGASRGTSGRCAPPGLVQDFDNTMSARAGRPEPTHPSSLSDARSAERIAEATAPSGMRASSGTRAQDGLPMVLPGRYNLTRNLEMQCSRRQGYPAPQKPEIHMADTHHEERMYGWDRHQTGRGREPESSSTEIGAVKELQSPFPNAASLASSIRERHVDRSRPDFGREALPHRAPNRSDYSTSTSVSSQAFGHRMPPSLVLGTGSVMTTHIADRATTGPFSFGSAGST